MRVLVGSVLVLLTWVVVGAVVTGVGLLPSLAVGSGRRQPSTVRAAIWWGVLLTAVWSMAASLITGLGSPTAGIATVAAGALLAAGGVVWLRRAGSPRVQRRPLTGWVAIALGGAAAVGYLAVAALAPVTNYDSGLYHLGAIRYAFDHPAIHGLANLYFPFGYSNAEFTLAALLGNGPWAGEGFRLLNGMLLALLLLDLFLRARGGRGTAGFFVLAVGAAATLVPMVALSDYWVTSPSSDSAVLTLTVVSAAYLADAVTVRREWAVNAGVVIATVTTLVLLRPTMIVFAVLAVAALALVGWRERVGRSVTGLVAVTAVIGITAGVVSTLRDLALSGWLLYPLSLYRFDVPWAAPDPTPVRLATLGAARDPNRLWQAAEGWGWVGGWFGRQAHQWESAEVLALVAVAAVLIIVGLLRMRIRMRVRRLLLAVLPSAGAVLIWWVASPPSFRFVWGPLFSGLAVVLGWTLWRVATRTPRTLSTWCGLTAVGFAGPVVAVVAFSAFARLDVAAITQERQWHLGIDLPYAVAPVPVVPAEDVVVDPTLTLKRPLPSDQCWSVYPLCTPELQSGIRLIGPDYPSGFEPTN